MRMWPLATFMDPFGLAGFKCHFEGGGASLESDEIIPERNLILQSIKG